MIMGILLVSVAVSSCLDSDNNYEYSSDATIRSFVLDTIYGKDYKFTIDQLRNYIYNVDSLPVGADSIIDRILIKTIEHSGLAITSGLNDTIFNMADSVNLSEPIQLKVHALDGITIRIYTIQVNVHKQDPDSLIWHEMESLPVSPVTGKPRSVILNEDLYVYTSPTTAYRSSISNPSVLQWDHVTVNGLPADAKLTSLINFDNQLYLTTESGKALYSANGTDWQEMDMQGMQMVTFVAGIPEDNVTGSPKALAGIFVKEGNNHFCTKSIEGTEWVKGEEPIPANFPIEDIYSTVFTNANGIEQVVVVGNTPEASDVTAPWFTMDGLSWVDMSEGAAIPCPGMRNPSIMYYGDMFYVMGGEFDTIYSSIVGLAWYKSEGKFRYPIVKVVENGENDTEIIKEENVFEGKGDYSLTIDNEHYIRIVWNTGEVWCARLNKLGFERQ